MPEVALRDLCVSDLVGFFAAFCYRLSHESLPGGGGLDEMMNSF